MIFTAEVSEKQRWFKALNVEFEIELDNISCLSRNLCAIKRKFITSGRTFSDLFSKLMSFLFTFQ